MFKIDFKVFFSRFIPLLVSLIPFIFIVAVIVLFIVFWRRHIKIKFRTFLKKGFLPSRDIYGLYLYEGSQGSGKTYSIVEYLYDNNKNIEVFCNISGITCLNYTYFTGFKGLIELKHKLDNNELKYDRSKQLVFVYDEIFTELSRGDKLTKEVIDFLCQMRKRKIIFLTTAQYWAELPITYRRFCRYQISCKMKRLSLLRIGVLVKTFRDAKQMKWSQEDQEFIAPIIETTVTKCRLDIANSYDTYLRISSVGTGSMPVPDTEHNINNLSMVRGGITQPMASICSPIPFTDKKK